MVAAIHGIVCLSYNIHGHFEMGRTSGFNLISLIRALQHVLLQSIKSGACVSQKQLGFQVVECFLVINNTLLGWVRPYLIGCFNGIDALYHKPKLFREFVRCSQYLTLLILEKPVSHINRVRRERNDLSVYFFHRIGIEPLEGVSVPSQCGIENQDGGRRSFKR